MGKLTDEKIDELERIVSGKTFDQLSEEDMQVITGAVGELDTDPETTPATTIILATAAVCVSAVTGLVSYKKSCLG